MKKLLASLALSLGLIAGTTPKAEAVIGLIVSAPAVVTTGGVVAALGGGTAVISLINLQRRDCPEDCVWNSIAFTLLGGAAAAVGIVILDGDQQGEIAYAPVSVSTAGHNQFSMAEIQTYNRELARLNAIQQTITAEVAANPRLDARARWLQLGARLSPATLEIAAFNGQQLLNQLK